MPKYSERFRRISTSFLLITLGIALALLLVEALLRLFLPNIPGAEITFAQYLAVPQRSPGDPRLFPAGYSVEFDVRGLYMGADKVTFHVGPNRFIEPEPREQAKYTV